MAIVVMHTSVPFGAKHYPLSDGAFRLWVAGLCWSKENLTDGFIPEVMIPVLHRDGATLAAELLTSFVPGKCPLWEPVSGGFQMHDYDDWQDMKDDIQVRRTRWKELKARQRAKGKEDDKRQRKTTKKARPKG